jgi:hypothetical protein
VPFMRSEAFAAACRMPPGLKLYPADRFDSSKSEVVAWLIAQPEIQQWVFEQFQISGALVYDWVRGTWGGNSTATTIPRHGRGGLKNTSSTDERSLRNSTERVENEMRIKSLVARIPLPASADYDALEGLIQRELNALDSGEYLLSCELEEMAIKILDEIDCQDVFLGTNINLVCPHAYRYGQMLREKHTWAVKSDYLNFHEILTSIISTSLSKFEEEERVLVPGALLEEIEPHSGHWRGFRQRLAGAVGHRAAEMIMTARTEIGTALDQREKEGQLIIEGDPAYEKIPKAGPHLG